jgi:hypothetical protein
MTVTLQNRSPRQRVFHIEHAAACTEEKCFCGRALIGVQRHDAKTGRKTLTAFQRRIPDSITLNAFRSEGDSISGLPNGILQAREVSKAIRRRAIAWSTDGEKVVAHGPNVIAKLAAQKSAAATAKAHDEAVERAARRAETIQAKAEQDKAKKTPPEGGTPPPAEPPPAAPAAKKPPPLPTEAPPPPPAAPAEKKG